MSDLEIIDTAAGSAQLKRTGRKTLAISVLPTGDLELIAPEAAPLEAILKKVEKRLRWIRTQRRLFRDMNAVRPSPRYVSGATHRYLGRQYLLKVTAGSPAKVSLRGGFLHVEVPYKAQPEVKKALQEWYRSHARHQFQQRLKSWHTWCLERRLPLPHLRLRAMSKRWGSALPDGTICLNPDLIKAPSACVDYVIIHEICHLKHPDHGKHFWSLLSQLVPDWKERKQRLESMEL